MIEMSRNGIRSGFRRAAAVALMATIGIAAFVLPAQAEDAAFSDAQREAIGDMVRDYLLDHPEVIMEALSILEERRLAEQEKMQAAAMAQLAGQIEERPLTPVIGNEDGDVTIIEFSDYNCPYCKSIANKLIEYTEDDGGIRHVILEFPILGEASVTAARIALAAEMQGKYQEVREALMGAKGRLSEAAMMAMAEKAGADRARLEKDMRANEISAILEENHRIAQSLGVTGTPAFVVGDEFIGGVVPLEEFDRIIKAKRG